MTQNGFSLVVSYKEKVKDSRSFHPEHMEFYYYVFVICMPIMYLEPEKEGQWAVYYTSLQSFIMFSNSLA